eukprot:jgi/Psemu1/7408/gm1.7408_g
MTSSPPNITSSNTNGNDCGTPWVERYRPRTLGEVSHQTEVVSTLQNAVRTGRLPHLLLYGPPGSGKTSVALALCKELWHPTQWRRRVLELNASDERGISVVREKIKQFASLSVGKGGCHGNSSSIYMDMDTTTATTTSETKQEEEKKYPNPPFKVIILDEADTVTKDAQAALRRIIEAHSRITRFILICNYVTRIIEPLASRCAKFRFQALPPSTMKERITAIAHAEGSKLNNNSNSNSNNNNSKIVVTERQIDAVLAVSGGDMRRAVTSLQSVQALLVGQQRQQEAQLRGGTTTTTMTAAAAAAASAEIDEDTIYELAGLPPDSAIEALYQSLLSRSFDTMHEAVKTVIANGYSVQVLLQKFLDKIIDGGNNNNNNNNNGNNNDDDNDDDLTELGRARLAIRIAEAEDKLNDGADEYLQLMTVCGLALSCLQQPQQQQ